MKAPLPIESVPIDSVEIDADDLSLNRLNNGDLNGLKKQIERFGHGCGALRKDDQLP
jgi:hypothetical protein